MHYKGKDRKKRIERERERREREKERKKADVSFPCFFRASNLPLVNMFVKDRQRMVAKEGSRRPPGSRIRSSVTNDSSEKFALLLAPLAFQVFQSAKNSQTDIYLEGFTLRYTSPSLFLYLCYRRLFPPARPSTPGALSNHPGAFDFSFSCTPAVPYRIFL